MIPSSLLPLAGSSVSTTTSELCPIYSNLEAICCLEGSALFCHPFARWSRSRAPGRNIIGLASRKRPVNHKLFCAPAVCPSIVRES